MAGVFRRRQWIRRRQPAYLASSPPGQCYEDTILADSPSFAWPLGEASGNGTDIVGAKTGTANGTPVYGVTGPVVGYTAIQFDSSTDFFSFADHADLDLGNGPFTIELFAARDTDSGTFEGIIEKGSNAYAVSIDGGGAAGFTDKLMGGQRDTAVHVSTNSTIAADSSWHHYAWTRDGSQNDIIYVDGTAASTDNASGGTLVDTADSLIIGRESASFPFIGRIAWVAFYKSALSGSRVAAHYAARNTPCAGGTIDRTASDTVALTESVARVFSGARTLSDSVTLGNTVARTGTFLRSVADSVGLSDAVVRAVTAARTAADSVTLGNTVARVFNGARTLADSVTIGNSVSRTVTNLRTASDTVALTESVAALKVILRTLADTVGLSDAVTRTGTFLRSVSDSVTAGNTVARTGTFLRSVSDSVTLGNTVARVVTNLRTAADTVSLSETVAGIKIILRTAADSISIGNTVARTGTFLRSVADTVTIAESVAASKIGGIVSRTVADTLTVADSVARVVTNLRTAADSVSFATIVDAVSELIIGGFAPIASAINHISRAVASRLRPGGSASDSKPGGDAKNPRP